MINKRSEIWDQGFEDGVSGYNLDQDYILELCYKKDINEYISGFIMGAEHNEYKGE